MPKDGPHGDPGAEVEKLISKYTRFTTPYKIIDSHEITVDVLVPNEMLSASTPAGSITGAPLIARFHGGGLVTGASLFTGWLAPWNFHYAQRHCAIMVFPNYRLLPESSAVDLLEDLSDFWKWVANDLQLYISANTKCSVRVDLSKVITIGDSAGGYFAVQSGFMASNLSPTLTIRGIIAPFPMIDLEDPWFTSAGHRQDEKFRGWPTVPYSVIEEHLTTMRQNNPIAPVSEDWNLERNKLIVAALQHGSFNDWFTGGGEISDEYYPMRRLQTVTSYPSIFIMHGRQDSAVPVEGSIRFIAALRERIPSVNVLLEVHDGEHGFGNEHSMTKGWLARGLAWFDESAIIAMLTLFSTGFVFAWAPLTSVITTELPCLRLRDPSQRTASVVNVVCNFSVNFSIPYLLYPDYAGIGSRVGFVFAGILALAVIFDFCCVPECKGRSLERIDHLSNEEVRLRKFGSYEFGRALVLEPGKAVVIETAYEEKV